MEVMKRTMNLHGSQSRWANEYSWWHLKTLLSHGINYNGVAVATAVPENIACRREPIEINRIPDAEQIESLDATINQEAL